MDTVFEPVFLVVWIFGGCDQYPSWRRFLVYATRIDFFGLPPQVANGTNRIAIVVQSLVEAVGIEVKEFQVFPLLFI